MLALQNTLAHFISKLVKEQKRDAVMPFFLHWVHVFIGVSLLIAAGGFLFRAPLAAFWGGVPTELIVGTFLVLSISLWMNLFYGFLQGMQSFVWLAWAPQAWGGTRLLLGGLFTIFISATALAALIAQGVGVLIVLVLCSWAVLTLRLPPRSSVTRPRGTYRYLGASLICLAGYAMLMNLDTTLAKHYFDAETVGLFAKAATIARTPCPSPWCCFPKSPLPVI